MPRGPSPTTSFVCGREGLLSALLLATSLVGSGCQGEPSSEADAEGEAQAGAESPTAVQVEVVEVRDLERTLRRSTHLEPREAPQVIPRQQGVVTEILVEEGDPVGEGDVLAVMDDEEWRHEARRAEARFEVARREAERAAHLRERDVISEQEAEGAETEADVARADWELAQLRLRRSRLRAPVDGIVTHRHIERGDLLSTSEPAFQVADTRALEARLPVPEHHAGRVEPGQPVRVHLEDGRDGPAPGHVSRVRPVVDPESGTVQVTIELDPDASADIRPGRFVNVDIVTEMLRDRLAVPQSAVLSEGGGSRAFVVRGGEAHEVELSLGSRHDGRVEIRSGLEPGDTLVTVGHHDLSAGARVRITEVGARRWGPVIR